MKSKWFHYFAVLSMIKQHNSHYVVLLNTNISFFCVSEPNRSLLIREKTAPPVAAEGAVIFIIDDNPQERKAVSPPSEEGGGLAEQSDGKTEGEITTVSLMYKRCAEDEV